MNTKNKPISNKIDFSNFTGAWLNTYDDSKLIEKIIIKDDKGELRVRVFGVIEGYCPGDWGALNTTPLTKKIDSAEVVAFKVMYKKNDFEAFLAVNDNKGLLIIATYLYFKDESNRNDIFTREFYCKV